MSILSTTVPLQRSKILSNTHINHHLAHPKSLNSNPLKRSISIKKPDHWPVPHGTKTSSGQGGQDFGKPERVHRLHSAIKNRSIKECLDLAGEECRDYYSFLQAVDPFELSKKVLGMFHAFLVANRVQFVIKPTKDEGVDLGMKWRLEWKENHLPLGLGRSLRMSHVYEGMVTIRKAKNIIEPLLHMGALGLKLEKIFLPMIDRIVPTGILEGKRRAASMYCLLSLIFLILFLVSLKNTFVSYEEK
ncbi:hypothetical protein COCNU_01G012310 [Cocos nucifera]|uniref:Uncharacterized protein n=1 Tax=Cocos nucifera TaxID=13894 RepID=A0A8K0MUX5_COCNU|nr:hypothetical protein COCNU_01G012310 [Cocos nucifera]